MVRYSLVADVSPNRRLQLGYEKSWCVGMADEADSKSVVGNHVWVQVPPPALLKMLGNPVKWGVLGFFIFRKFENN